MAQEWLEVVSARQERAKLHRLSIDGVPSQRYSSDAVIGRLHYPGVLDSGVHDTELDLTPQRVDNPQFDGWRVEQNSWHYALGKDLVSHGSEDGWVGFGGRQGQHWLKFRALRVGYLHWPTRAWEDIGGVPDYNRARLSRQTNSTEFPVVGASIPTSSVATWERIWSTPGGGQLDVAWTAGGYGLKEEIRINQAGRDWIAANRPPSTPAAETWFGFAFELDWSDVPRIYRQGILQDPDTDFADDDESIELRDALDRLLAFMPISEAYVEDSADPLGLAKLPLRKRFYTDAGRHYLLVGARVPELNAMPAGDLVFDPTVDEQVGASGDDGRRCTGSFGFSNSDTSFAVGWNTASQLYQVHHFYRWLGITISDTIDVAYVECYEEGGGTNTPELKMYGVDQDNPAAPTSAAEFDADPLTAAGIDWDGAWTDATWEESPSLITIFQELVDTYTIDGDAVMVQLKNDHGEPGSSEHNNPRFYNFAGNAHGPKLHIEYSVGGVTLTPTPASVMIVATNPTLGLSLALTPTPASVPIVAPNPVVGLGVLTLTPTPATIPIVAADPTVALILTLTPTAATIPIVAADPTVGLGVLTLTPTPATIPIVAADPVIAFGILTLTPTPATIPIVAADPTVGLTLTLTPTAATIPILVADPAVGLGVLAISPTPVTIPLIVPDPAVGLAYIPILLDLGARGFVLYLRERDFELELGPRSFVIDLEER